MTENPDKKRFSVTLARPILDALDRLVEAGAYIDHQDVIRDFIRHGLQRYGLDPCMTLEPPEEPQG